MDEASDVSKSVANANPNAAVFTLLPQYHTSTDLASVVAHRRTIEDKLMGTLGCENNRLIFCSLSLAIKGGSHLMIIFALGSERSS